MDFTGALFTLIGILFTLIGNVIINLIKNRLDSKGLTITAEEKLRADLQKMIERLDKENLEKDQRIERMETHYTELSLKVQDLNRENHLLTLKLDEEIFKNKRLEQHIKELVEEIDQLRKEKTR